MTVKKILFKNIDSRQCFERLSKEAGSYLVDVRTKPEWSFVGLPDLQSLQKKTMCVSWNVYPNMEINVNFESEILESGINKQDAIFFNLSFWQSILRCCRVSNIPRFY